MKEIKLSVLGITQSGKTTAILHMAKNFKNLMCLCDDCDSGRTKISVRYYFSNEIIKDEFKVIKCNDDGSTNEQLIESVTMFASIINSDNGVERYDYAEAYLIPNEKICKILTDKNCNQIVVYDTRGLMDIATKTDDENNETKITDLTKIGIDNPDAVLFFYAQEGSTSIKSLYTKLIKETFDSTPFFVFVRADDHDKKKYSNLINGIFKFFKSIYIKLNLNLKVNDVEVKADFELANKIETDIKVEIKTKNNNTFVIPYFNEEKDVIYRLSEYDISTFEDKYINEINEYVERIVSNVINYNSKMKNEKLLQLLSDDKLEKEICDFAIEDIKKYEGGLNRKTNYCYPEKNQGTNYKGLMKYYKNRGDGILGPNGGISNRDGGYIYFYTIVMCTLVHNVLYCVFNSLKIDDELKSLLRTALSKFNDSFYCSSFLFDRFGIKESIESFRRLNIDDDVLLFKQVVKNALNKVKEHIEVISKNRNE